MAIKSHTTYTYTCDLCGMGYSHPHDLANLYVKYQDLKDYRLFDDYEKAMLCVSCQSKPISELITYFRRKNGIK